MKIAWQYKKYLEGADAAAAQSALADWAHSFDLNKNIDASVLEGAQIVYSDLTNIPKSIDANLPEAERKFRKIYLDLNQQINTMNTCA
jgi:hypothetical protein